MKKIRGVLSGILIVGLILTSGVSVFADSGSRFIFGDLNSNRTDGIESDQQQEGELGCCQSNIAQPPASCEEVDDLEIRVAEHQIDEVALYEALKFVYMAQPVIHIPDEQNIAIVFADESMILTSAILHVRSEITGVESEFVASNIVGNGALFTINYLEGSYEDKILLVGVSYTFSAQYGESPLRVDFSDQFYGEEIELTYTIANILPYPTSEDFEILVYGFDEMGNEIVETASLEELERTVTAVLESTELAVGDYEDIDVDTAYVPYGSNYMGIAPTSGNLGMAAGTGIAPSSNNRIIVVSAAHCPTHPGASHNGLIEHELTWEVAGIVVNELNTFNGITAHRDRPTINCRYPGQNTSFCVTQRIRDARAIGASIFVDIHFNGFTNPSANGAEVWIPNNTHNQRIRNESMAMAQAVLNNLVALGFTNRGVVDNVSRGQGWEFATNRIAAELGMSSILVEAGFLSNPTDAARIANPAFRRDLGIQIARGIAASLGKNQTPQPPPPPPQNVSFVVRTANVNQAAGTFDIIAGDIVSPSGVDRVVMRVWSRPDQRDLRSYTATRQSNGTFRATVNIANHGFRVGVYNIQAQLTATNNATATREMTHNVARPNVSITSANVAGNESAFTLTASNVVGPFNNITGVHFEIWTRANRSDLIVRNATRGAQGVWTATSDTRNHPAGCGNFQVQAWGVRPGGARILLATTTVSVGNASARIDTLRTENINEVNGTFDIITGGIVSPSGVSRVRVRVWSRPDQRDARFYNTTSLANGNFRATANIANHEFRVGLYNIQAHVTLGNGQTIIRSITHNVARPAVTVSATQAAGSQTVFNLTASNVVGPFGNATGVHFEVWSRSDRRDLVVRNGTRGATGVWTGSVDTRSFPAGSGTFQVQAWATRPGGGRTLLATTTFGQGQGGSTSELISIMGQSQTTVAQMVRNFNNSGHTYPMAVFSRNGGPATIQAFAQLVFDEANREGVRAEVLWTQVMRETGWLQFGGDVRNTQNNFGGIGATGGGNPGHSFPSVQIGLRAQVHHLVAYATTEPVRHPSNTVHPVMRTSPPWGQDGDRTVVNGTESPRFHLVTRGISPYVNWLGQGENPNHPGFWAADREYGARLAAAIRALLSS